MRFRSLAPALALILELSVAAAAPKTQASPQSKLQKVKAAKRYKPGKKLKATKTPRVKTAKHKKTKHA